MPVCWTNFVDEDPVVIIATGRSYFRVEDLLRLAQMILRMEE